MNYYQQEKGLVEIFSEEHIVEVSSNDISSTHDEEDYDLNERGEKLFYKPFKEIGMKGLFNYCIPQKPQLYIPH